ncbi:DUF3604 domain-containing protein [Algibacter mikhailovii]|uniref:DUF3604 domain-containing protein n=1 Tax=Algibacter mikhailovii TaxID=425498 RepID=A0A918RD79_9FLAO|nr:DUF3604 domain-containing protein [Algibacter mikhailovii]GGZ94467.1 hypothetical protein GCM10007028_35960 [Algibacter mikhailovii]
MKKTIQSGLLTLITILAIGCGTEEQKKTAENKQEKTITTNVKSNPLKDVYWGDTHLHTAQSFDAIAFGTFLGPEEAYRFALGEEITSSTGVPAKLSRPLDFLVVADHAESMGILGEIKAGNPKLMGNETIQRWNKMLNDIDLQKSLDVYEEMAGSVQPGADPLPDEVNNEEIITSIWHKNIDAAEKYNSPGKFTALIGYEWSSNTGGNNLHRVVIYKDGKEKTIQVLPFSSQVSDDPEDLWKALQAYETTTGGNVLAIPHNGNLSNGRMFPLINPVTGKKFSKKYVQNRNKFEVLYEATQIKGDGEAHPTLSPNDEFADYETWDKGNLDLTVDKTDDMLQFEYARNGLLNGLKLKSELGVNPYKYGMIGSTDAHTGIAAVAENNFFGKLPHMEPSDHRIDVPMLQFGDKKYMGWEMVSSGYTAVWAESNTREDLFDAMTRKEVYATTGSRIKLRFFGGWDFNESDLNNNYVQAGYDRGVPMGGDLKKPDGDAPSFLIHALMDPESGSLDRIQVVKGWIDAEGSLKEKVYDVAWSGDRKKDVHGKVPLVGNTVNLNDGSWSNDIGAVEFKKMWTDPNFDETQEAFYYVRVIEIPTPRWTLHDKIRFGLELSSEVPLTTTERAYSSPIWYSPDN